MTIPGSDASRTVSVTRQGIAIAFPPAFGLRLLIAMMGLSAVCAGYILYEVATSSDIWSDDDDE